MNIIDLLILLLAGIFAWRGFELGLVRQLASIIGFVVGLFVGNWIAAALDSSLAVSVLIIILTIVITAALSELLGARLKRLIHTAKPLHGIDRALGSAGGVLVCGIIVWIGSIVLPTILPPGSGHLVRDSRIIGWLDQTLPPATDVMAALDDSLNERGIFGDFGLNPNLDQQQSSLPSLDTFSNAIDQRQASVLRIEGRACSGLGTGSGFVAASGLVLTNAHVVAGMRYPFVESSDGQRWRAHVVHFDSDLDIAVLSVSNLGLEAIPFASNDPVAGDPGVVLGYPGGGDFTTSPARVLERFTAISRDIYGDRETRRTVFGLHADVEPGNSGGPMLSSGGEVMGVIFARSTTTDAVGYMLANTAVQQALSAGQTGSYGGTAHLRCAPANP